MDLFDPDLRRPNSIGLEPVSPPFSMLRTATHTILFGGHRIDDGDRPAPRFPPGMEPAARRAIREALTDAVRAHETVRGIAGGASGADILFHEVCAELGIPTTIYLPMARSVYVEQSVAPAGMIWIRRFEALAARVPVVVMPHASVTGAPTGSGVWEANNEWLLAEGLADGVSNLTVLVLWNGVHGDGPGGTEQLVALAAARGVEVRVVDTKGL